ncbi:OmpA family protein [Sulfitobacter sp. HNIBRBA2951]|uniref:OmpA family protein n=1 Tax=Sulfitobacter aquimarinus TaxID=3158557 RepID=UPI0032DE6D79
MWIAPTFAIAVSTIALISSGVFSKGQQAAAPATFSNAVQIAPETTPSVQVQTPSQAPLIAPIEAVVAQATAPVAEATTPQVATEGESRWDKFNALVATAATKDEASAPQASEQNDVVTRAEPVDLLEIATEKATTERQAAAFFDIQKEALTANTFCGEDLNALAATTRIYFPEGGTAADPTGLIKARLMGQILNECPGYAVNVEGHSDPSGNSQVNLQLSQKRADSVIARLTSAGINTSRFVAVGMGDQTPSDVTGPESAAYYDRRVEFRLVKLVEDIETASISEPSFSWNQPSTAACVSQLKQKAAATKVTFEPRAIILDKELLGPVADLVKDAKACPGTRVRMVGHHSDVPGLRESYTTGRLRALALTGALIGEGHSSDQMLIGAPSYSVAVEGQPDAVRSRIDFQIITN